MPAPTPVQTTPASPSDRIYFDVPETGAILGLDDPGCQSCGPGGCNHCGRFGNRIGPCGGGCFAGLYVRAEYLLWGTKGADLPALVTTSPDDTPQADAGVLGEPGTEILFGGESVNSNVRGGGRLTFGWWFEPCRRLGVEGEYFALKNESEDFEASSDGTPILARPFFDIVDGVENAELVAFPDLLRGTVAVRYETRFQGAGVRGIYNLACGDGCGTSCITCCPVPTGYRFDLLAGYRFLRLDDRLDIVESLVTTDTSTPGGAFLLRDQFATENEFHGFDMGSSMSWCKGCWSLDILSKLAIGSTRSRIDIAGSTIITEEGQSETFQGGLLAQRTNIGHREFDEFAVVPELGVTVGYQLNPCWRVTLGYTFIYWSRVARAGDQIDRDINTGLLPPEQVEVETHLRPAFNLTYTDFWAQGLTAGLEGSW
ncbi:MAG: BBP7 family outer membrane beta-barrel protein [Planctomycetaceae bacterium]|nr:BBP7 family outer membrane beta-barrel protein [Planctomycetaceae bacterium]